MLRDTLKREIDQLGDNQLQKIADLISSIKNQEQPLAQSMPFWQRATPTERAQDLRSWVSQLPKTNISLADTAFDRGSIYE